MTNPPTNTTNTNNQGTNMPTQEQLITAAWQQLAIIGGELTREDDITFEGTAWNIPAIYRDNLHDAAKAITRLADAQYEMVVVERTFKYRPLDGAHATYQMLKKYFGYAQAHRDMFGPPPNEVTISVGFHLPRQVLQLQGWVRRHRQDQPGDVRLHRGGVGAAGHLGAVTDA
jgi:hypothetical protein